MKIFPLENNPLYGINHPTSHIAELKSVITKLATKEIKFICGAVLS